MERVQTDNGFEFTNRFSNSKRDLPTLFERTAAELGIRHKRIRPYTPRHNGKAERSHRSNDLPMRPLRWLSPNEFIVQSV